MPFGPSATGPLATSATELHRSLAFERDPEFDPISQARYLAGLSGTDTFQQETLLAVSAGKAIGQAIVSTGHMDTNQDKCEVELEVHPDYRRHGVGTALLAGVLEIADSHGRTSLGAYNSLSEQSTAFWNAFGADLKLVERESRMWLKDTDEELMHKWVADRFDRASDYRLEHYKGHAPAHLLPAIAYLNNAMNDAPIDDAELEDDIWTESDVIDLEKIISQRGRERWVTVAFGPNDEPAGQTALSIVLENPKFSFQGNTAVDAAHRNKGIGRWLKADMWLRLRSEAPAVEALHTDNAASNEGMLAINVAMGFKPLHEWGFYQAKTSTIEAHLKARRG